MNLHHVVEAIGILVSGLLFYSYTSCSSCGRA
jgi:hypothetical protein